MRLTRSMCCSMLLAGAACSSGLTAPPNGLSVALTRITTQEAHAPSIIGAGDSVTAVVLEFGLSPCSDAPTASAGLRGDELVMTLSQRAENRACPASLAALSQFKIVVHDVPSGARPVRVVLRVLSGGHATYTTLASDTITLP